MKNQSSPFLFAVVLQLVLSRFIGIAACLMLCLPGLGFSQDESGTNSPAAPAVTPSAAVTPSVPTAQDKPGMPAVPEPQGGTNAPAFTSLKDKASYAFGLQFGLDNQRTNDLNLNLFMQGISDTAKGHSPRLNEADARDAFIAYQKVMKEKAQSATSVAFETNKKIGEAFLEANAKRDGVVVLPSGLQYKIMKKGTGKKPAKTDQVIAHYIGTLIDGKTFDSSRDRGEPLTMPLNRVIPGWTEGITMMPVGSRFMLYIPQELAYRNQARGLITPGSTLVFDIELIGIK